MTDPVVVKLIWLGAVLVAYGLFRWRWLVATQGIVIRTVQDAERWSQSRGASAPTKDLIARLTNAAYRPLAIWCIAVVASLGVLVGAVRGLRKHNAARSEAADEEAVVTLRLFCAALTTSPITLVLVAAACCLALLLRGSAKTVLDLMPAATLFGWRLHQPST